MTPNEYAERLQTISDEYGADLQAATERMRRSLLEVLAGDVEPIDAAALLGAQPDAEGATGEVPAAVHGRPSPSSAPLSCSHCERAFANAHALSVHVGRSHRAIEAPAPAKAVLPPQPSSTPAIDAPPRRRPGNPRQVVEVADAEPSGTVGRSGDPGPLNGHRSPAAPTPLNPRSARPLELPPRIDQAVGQ